VPVNTVLSAVIADYPEGKEIMIAAYLVALMLGLVS